MANFSNSYKKDGVDNSLFLFKQTELGANFNKLFKDKSLPFKYRTFVYLQKILFSKEVEDDIQKFRAKEY